MKGNTTRTKSKKHARDHYGSQKNRAYFLEMSIIQVILAIIFPPLAVLDKGCGSIIIVSLLTACGWIPGVIAALVIVNTK